MNTQTQALPTDTELTTTMLEMIGRYHAMTEWQKDLFDAILGASDDFALRMWCNRNEVELTKAQPERSNQVKRYQSDPEVAPVRQFISELRDLAPSVSFTQCTLEPAGQPDWDMKPLAFKVVAVNKACHVEYRVQAPHPALAIAFCAASTDAKTDLAEAAKEEAEIAGEDVVDGWLYQWEGAYITGSAPVTPEFYGGGAG